MLIFFFAGGCRSEFIEEPIPLVPVNFNINLMNPQFLDLQDLGWVYLNNEGVRGVVIIKKSPGDYLVLDRNCSFRPNDACATVDMHPSGFYLIDTCCGSTFDLDGFPSSGPAINPLRNYFVRLEGDYLHVTNELTF
jgi:hypothetical protein